jgi:hypothetical protein
MNGRQQSSDCTTCGEEHGRVCEIMRQLVEFMNDYKRSSDQRRRDNKNLSVTGVIQIVCTFIMGAIALYGIFKGAAP